VPPQQRWEAGAFIPRMPDSRERLDLLLLTVTKSRKVHPDGIHFPSLSYLDPVLAAYVGESVRAAARRPVQGGTAQARRPA
jgi:putative transposase